MKKYFCTLCGRSYDTNDCPKHKVVLDDVSVPSGYDCAYEDALKRLGKPYWLLREVGGCFRAGIGCFSWVIVLPCFFLALYGLDLTDPGSPLEMVKRGLHEVEAITVKIAETVSLLEGKFSSIVPEPLSTILFAIVGAVLFMPIILIGWHLFVPATLFFVRVMEGEISLVPRVLIFPLKFFVERILGYPFLLTVPEQSEELLRAPFADSFAEYMKKRLARAFSSKKVPLTLQHFVDQTQMEAQKSSISIESKKKNVPQRKPLVHRVINFFLPGLELLDYVDSGLSHPSNDRVEVTPKPDWLALLRSDPRYYTKLPQLITSVLFFNLPWFEEWVRRKGKNVPPPWDERFLSQIPEGAKTRPVVGRPET